MTFCCWYPVRVWLVGTLAREVSSSLEYPWSILKTSLLLRSVMMM